MTDKIKITEGLKKKGGLNSSTPTTPPPPPPKAQGTKNMCKCQMKCKECSCQKVECIHEKCSTCHGTGVKENGQQCVHYISCNCKKCNPFTL